MFKEGKLNMDLHFADIIHKHKMKAETDKWKMMKTKKYVWDM
jgi:hypothetical protein